MTLPVDPGLLARYAAVPVPRYTSYPTANLWPPQSEDFARAAYARAGQRPVSIYVHVPFCRRLCFYCGCNMVVTQRQELAERYLAALDLELARVRALLPRAPKVVQLHLGGGTPTWLDVGQLERLVASIQKRFPFKRGIEASIEVHPPVTTFAQVNALGAMGFNRISMGVQDFDPEVQQRINRPQPFGQTAELIGCARAAGMKSVNVDLMYGLPLQTAARFAHTLDQVEQLQPDRIALFGYAHLPRLKKHQRAIDPAELPDAAERLAIFQQAVDRLRACGYVAIGLDHFAFEEDDLCRARAKGTLRRNFMGYTTCGESDVLSFGPSAISDIGGTFVQNAVEVHDWAERLETGHLPVSRGWESTADDALRSALIMELFCQLRVDTEAFGRAHGLDFRHAFAAELAALAPLEADGLVAWRDQTLQVTALGQLLLRNVASVFDARLPKPAERSHAPAV